MLKHLCALIVSCAILPGCSKPLAEPAVSAGEPLGLQLLRTEAELRKYPFRNILEFEAPTDVVFVRTQGTTPRLVSDKPHTGASALLLDRGTRTLTVRLASLFSGSVFPGRWTLAGAYFFSPEPRLLSASYRVGDASVASITVQLPAGQWTPVLLDVAGAAGAADSQIGSLEFMFSSPLDQPLWCDDVVVLDNTETFIESPWSIRQRGFAYIVERPGVFRTVLQMPEAADPGWLLADDCGPIRAIFTTRRRDRMRVIYASGWELIDGRASALSPTVSPEAQHASPARIDIAPEVGRVVRNQAGDANNDGYIETRGSYLLSATGARVEFRFHPRVPVHCPVIEVADLPAGSVLATVEGRLIDRAVRLADGRLLIELPGVIERPVTVNLRVNSVPGGE